MVEVDCFNWSEGLLPEDLDLDTKPFWDAAKDHRLTYQTCDDCSALVFFPRAHCPSCLGSALSWRESSGKGTIYTFSVVRRSSDPRFKDRTPYCVAWIDLDEGFRMMSNVVGADCDDVRVGQRVLVTWANSGDAVLPVFELVAP